MKMGIEGKGVSYAIVIPRKLAKKLNPDKELFLVLEEDEEYDGKNIFHVRKVKLDR